MTIGQQCQPMSRVWAGSMTNPSCAPAERGRAGDGWQLCSDPKDRREIGSRCPIQGAD
jgi:hypothetical protein